MGTIVAFFIGIILGGALGIVFHGILEAADDGTNEDEEERR